MSNRKSACQLLVSLEQVTDICTGEVAAGGAVTLGVKRQWVSLIALVCGVHDAVPSEYSCVTCISAGHYAVEKVYSPCHALDDVGGSSHAHKVAYLIFGHYGAEDIKDMIHLLSRLAHCKAAHSVAVHIKLCYLFHMAQSQVIENRALIYSEKQLVLVDGIW